MVTRNEILLAGLTKSMSGLEIGPFYDPIAPKRAGWNVKTVDYADYDFLYRLAVNHDSEYIRQRAQNVESVDIV